MASLLGGILRLFCTNRKPDASLPCGARPGQRSQPASLPYFFFSSPASRALGNPAREAHESPLPRRYSDPVSFLRQNALLLRPKAQNMRCCHRHRRNPHTKVWAAEKKLRGIRQFVPWMYVCCFSDSAARHSVSSPALRLTQHRLSGSSHCTRHCLVKPQAS